MLNYPTWRGLYSICKLAMSLQIRYLNFVNLPFSDAMNFQNAELPMLRSQTNYGNSVFADKENIGTMLGHIFITVPQVVLISSIKLISSSISLSQTPFFNVGKKARSAWLFLFKSNANLKHA